MNAIKNIGLYTIVAGGGSVALSFFINNTWQQFAIGGLMIGAILIAVYDALTDGKSIIRLQFAPVRRPKESDVEAKKDELSGVYFAIGVIMFGGIALII